MSNGPLTRYVKLRVAHAPGMSGTLSPPPTSKENASKRSQHASRHVRHARAVMHVGIANPRWRGKCSRHSRRMRNTQFYVSGKRPMVILQKRSLHPTRLSAVGSRHPLYHSNTVFLHILSMSQGWSSEAMYISLIDLQWTSTETDSLIIRHSIMITCISCWNIFAILVLKCINIAPL